MNADETETPDLDVTPLHHDLYTAVAVGGLSDGKRLGCEAIRTRQLRTDRAFDQMLDIAEALDDPYIAARLQDLKEERQAFYRKAIRAFKDRFDSARDLVESGRVRFNDTGADPKAAECGTRDDMLGVPRDLDADQMGSVVKEDEYGQPQSYYTVAFNDGVPIVPTGDIVHRPHVIIEKYGLAHALQRGRGREPESGSRPLTA